MKITINNTYPLNNNLSGSAGSRTSVLVSGSLGAGVATVGYLDDFGTFIALDEGVLAIGDQKVFSHGVGVKLYVKLTGATGAALSIISGGLV